ncbi:MAG: T9SS type B sorting domain-containing protein, partial [Bacteroidia bacterium]|nr:T9SS type B sorting domain-containing protein [Bacteroidia bacterium]
FEITPNFGCDSALVSFIDSSYGVATYTWNFGNGNTSSSANPTPQLFDTLGNYLISLVATDSAGFGCSSVTSRAVTVLQAPSDSIYGDTTVCVGQNANLFYGGVDTVNTSFIWNFDGGTVVSGAFWGPFVVNWATPGVKKVTLSVTDVVTGCTSVPDTFEVTVIGTPVTSFSVAPSACIGQNIQVIFTGTAGPTATFNWSFVGATVVSGSGFGPYIINYAAAGPYSITLDIVDGNCPPATPTTHPIAVSITPTATFTLPAISCQNQSNLITYTGTASGAAMYTWNFGGGTVTSGTGQGPYVVEYPNVGTFFVTLTVTENGCTSATFTDSIVVNSAPSASFNLNTNLICGSDSVIVAFTGSAGAGAVYNWNFGTANVLSGTGSGPYTLSFPNAGWNIVSLDITENGCTSLTYADSVNAGFQPIANAGIDQTYCTLDSVQIGEAPTIGYNYTWSPASGLSNSNTSNPWVNVLNIGVTDTVIPFILTVDSLLCSDSDTVEITISPNQLTKIIASSGACLLGNNFTFINGQPQIIGATYNWDFGPNATPGSSTVINPSPITFNTVGTQTVILNASANGCPSVSDTFLLEIYPMPVTDFISDKIEGCPPLLVQFTDASVTDTGSTYDWSFGGITSNMQNPAISFTQPGILDVSLIVTTSFGCRDTMIKNSFIDVWVKPTASILAEPPNTNIFFPNIDFTNTSVNGTTCFYDFGDGFTSTACNVSHTYADTGTYYVTFITTNNLGCPDTVIQKINVDPFYTFYAPNAFTPNSDLVNDLWVWQGSNINEFEMRVFNRWGQLVYETDNFFGFWNGRWQNEGDLVQDGVYVYEVLLREGTGRQRAFGGYVFVLK